MRYTLTDKAIAILLSFVLFIGSASGFMTGFDEQENTTEQPLAQNEFMPFNATSYTLTVYINSGNGSLLANGNIAFPIWLLEPTPTSLLADTLVTFAANPSPGLGTKWTIIGGSFASGGEDGNNSATLNMTGNITVYVDFALLTSKLFFDDTDKIITATAGATTYDPGDDVLAGTNITFSAPAPGGNFFVRWFAHKGTTPTDVNPGVIGDGNTVSFLMPANDVFVERRLIPGRTVSYGVVGTHSGGISAKLANDTQITSGAVIEDGSTVVFTASLPTAPGFYRVAQWTVGGTPQEADASSGGLVLTLSNINSNTDVRVRFERINLNLSSEIVTISTLGTITINVTLTGDVTIGTITPAGTLTAVPASALPTGLTVTPSGNNTILVQSTSYLTDADNTEGSPHEVTISLDGVDKTLLIHIDLPFLEIIPPAKIDITNTALSDSFILSTNVSETISIGDITFTPALPTELTALIEPVIAQSHQFKITISGSRTAPVTITDREVTVSVGGFEDVFVLNVKITPPPQITSITPTAPTVTAFANVSVHGSGAPVNAVFNVSGTNFSDNVDEVKASIRAQFLSVPAWITAGSINVEVTGNNTATVTIALTVPLNNPGTLRSGTVTIGTDPAISSGITGTLSVSQVGPISLSPTTVSVTEANNTTNPGEVAVAGSGTITLVRNDTGHGTFTENVHISFSTNADENKIIITTTRPAVDIVGRSFTVTFTRDGISATLTINVSIKALDMPSVTWPTGFSATYGQTLSSVSTAGTTTAGSAVFESTPVPGTFVWSVVAAAPDTRVGNAGTQSHSMTFIPTDETTYARVTTTGASGFELRSVAVAKANPSVTWPTGLTLTYEDTLSQAAALGIAGSATFNGMAVSGTFTFTRGDAATFKPTVAQSGSYEMIFTPTGTDAITGDLAANFNTATTNVPVTVLKKNQDAPAAPTANASLTTAVSITLYNITDAQFIMRTSNTPPSSEADWADAQSILTFLTFDNLSPHTPYYFFARLPGDDNHNASSSSPSREVWTLKAALDGTLAISGSAVYRETLTADISGLFADPPGAPEGHSVLYGFTYQWNRNDIPITGATNSTYTLTAADIEATISVTVGTENTNNELTSPATAEVARRTPVLADLSYTPTSVPYNKSQQQATVTGAAGIGGITVEYSENGTTWSSTAPTNAGNYQIRAQIEQGARYTAATVSLDSLFIITKIEPKAAELTATMPGVTISWQEGFLTTPPVAEVVAASGVERLGSITVLYSLNGDALTETPPVSTGTIRVYANIAEGGNYTAATAIYVGTYTITGIDIPGVTAQGVDVTYDGDYHSISVSIAAGGGEIHYSTVAGGGEGGPWTQVNPQFRNVTTDTKVFYRITRPGTGYYPYFGEVTVTIEAIELTWSTGSTVNNKPYDGKSDATVLITPTLLGIIEDDDVTVVAGTVSFDRINVEDGIGITAASWGVEGEDIGNYIAPTAEPLFENANITPRQLTWSTGNTVNDKPYDGTNSATVLSAPTLVGVVEGDDITVATGTVNFESINAEDGIEITAADWGVDWGISGDGNYTAPSQQPVFALANITKVTLTPILDVSDVTGREYNGETTITGAQPTISLEGAVGDEEPEVTASFAFVDMNAGTNKNVIATDITLTEDWEVNYELSEDELTEESDAEITSLQLSWSVGSANDKIYDGNKNATVALAPTLIGVLPIDIEKITVRAGSVLFDSSDVGEDVEITALEWGINGNENYDAPVEEPLFGTANIDPRPLTGNVAIIVTDTDPIDGRIAEGSILTADLTSVIGVPAGAKITEVDLIFAWYRDGLLIDDATGNTYIIGAPEQDPENSSITVKITGIDNYTGTLESRAETVGQIPTPLMPSEILSISPCLETAQIFENISEEGIIYTAKFDVIGINLTQELLEEANVFGITEFPAWLLPSNLQVEFVSDESATVTVTLSIGVNTGEQRSGTVGIGNTITEEITGSLLVSQAAATLPPVTYQVIILNSPTGVTAPTGQSDPVRVFEPRMPVTLDAGIADGYSFENWSTNSQGVEFEDENEAVTSFVMPDNDVIITANWKEFEEEPPEQSPEPPTEELPPTEEPPTPEPTPETPSPTEPPATPSPSPEPDDNTPHTPVRPPVRPPDDGEPPEPPPDVTVPPFKEPESGAGLGAWLRSNLWWIILSFGALVVVGAVFMALRQKTMKRKVMKLTSPSK
ncbi:MAG: YDG domain-containing protein [Oscillospiraceae bacterium]|nr:YDG domain-containing protein [Oscillospiraceae bacterium]